jgi:hypothetical protein
MLRSGFVVCIDSGANDDLQARRIYQVLADPAAARSACVRIIDDSGEDYIYPARLFVPFRPTAELRRALDAAASGN